MSVARYRRGQPLRILVTGSRYWREGRIVARGISGWLESIGTSIGAVWPVPTVVHGGNRRWDPQRREWYGADWHAGHAARTWEFVEERVPADWDRHGRRAGPLRNVEMVGRGADVCLAFPIGPSHGTRHCMEAAFMARIPVFEPATMWWLGDLQAPAVRIVEG